MKQLAFNFSDQSLEKNGSYLSNNSRFGSSFIVGKRKTKRPLSVTQPLHLILKSESKHYFDIRNQSLISLIEKQAQRFNIQIYHLVPNFSHIHLIIKIQQESDYIKFIRSLTSIMAIRIRKAYPEAQNIFKLRPFTRIIQWGKDYQYIQKYLNKNLHEAFGVKMHEEQSVEKENA